MPRCHHVFLTALSLCAVLSAQTEQWSQFRGPGSRGIAVSDAALPTEFGLEQNLIWKLPVGPGHSSPCIWGGRIFLTTSEGETVELLCIDRKTGEILWRRSHQGQAEKRLHRVNSAATPTPTADGERVYAYFGSVGMVCYDFEGEELWRREIQDQKNIYGTATSPILAGGSLIICRDTNGESFLESIEPSTGKTRWHVDRTGFPSGWSTPVLWEHEGIKELLVYGAFRLSSYDLADGHERWSVPGLADEPAITPVTGEGLVFVSSYNMNTNPEVVGLPEFETLLADYDMDGDELLTREEVLPNKSILSRMDADGEGDHPLRGFFRFLDANRDEHLDAKEWQKMIAWLGNFEHANALLAIRPGDGDERDAEIAWQFPRGVPECPSPLYHDGLVYIVKNGGMISCLEAESGQLEYQGRIGARGPRYSSPVYGDGKIYAASARGVVSVIAAGDELLVLAQNDLGERIMATPAIVNGHIYLRTEEHLFAFGLGG